MESLVNLQKKLIPDVIDVMSDRYRILQAVRFLQPIGRRSLSAHLGVTERILRGEVVFLGRQGLLHTAANGMGLTPDGERLLQSLEEVMKDVSGLTQLEKQLKTVLNLARVVIVPGNSDEQPWVKNEMGLASVKVMEACLSGEAIISVMGGTTLAAVADMMRPFKKNVHPLFVSARGGLGEQVENQANTICAKMAEKADGHYQLLHVPDQLSEESYLTLIEEPSIQEVLELFKKTGTVIHGIGDARTMALRRHSSEQLLKKIDQEQAVAEAFGYYFDKNGKVVHRAKTIGLQLEDLYENRTVIAVAGGRSKANAIEAYFKENVAGPDSVLVTDEGAAEHILSKINL